MKCSLPIADLLLVPRLYRTIAFVLTVAVACGPEFLAAHEGHEALPSTGATVEGDRLLLSHSAERTLGLRTARATLGDLRQVLRVNARVELPWQRQALVTTLVPGRVERVLVRPGETVRSGQELARIESQELESLQLELFQAAAAVDLGRRLVAHRTQVVRTGTLASSALREAESDLRQQTDRLQTAVRRLLALGLTPETIEEIRSTEQALRSIPVVSPQSGMVVEADVRTGQFVDTTEHLFHVVDPSQVQIVGEVLESDIETIRPGLPVVVRFAALPETAFSGRIARTGVRLEKNTRTLDVVVPVENRGGHLRAGMFGRMEIAVRTANEAVVCPAEALIESGSTVRVLIREREGRYQLRSVEVGLRAGKQVEILDGLFPGDEVIVTGTQILAALFSTDTRSLSGAAQGSGVRSQRPGVRMPLVAHPSSLDAHRRPAVTQASVVLPTAGQTFAAAAIEGRVRQIRVNPGEEIRAGQVLAELDSQELRRLQLDLLQAREKLRWAEETVGRLEPLARRGAVAERELWQPQTDLRMLRQEIDSLARRLALIGLSSDEIARIAPPQESEAGTDGPEFLTVPIRAPADGLLAEFALVPGQIVRSDQRLFEIHALDKVWIEGWVFEPQAPFVRIGQEAVVTFPAYPELTITGPVVRIAPTLHRASRVLPVWIEVENPGHRLREGMLARVELVDGEW